MSLQGVGVIMERIKLATQESPITVFKIDNFRDTKNLDAFFGATAFGKALVKNYPDRLVGTYSRMDDPKKVLQELTEAVNERVELSKKWSAV